jgi:hypothetical protein
VRRESPGELWIMTKRVESVLRAGPFRRRERVGLGLGLAAEAELPPSRADRDGVRVAAFDLDLRLPRRGRTLCRNPENRF